MPKNLELSYLIDFYGNALTEKQREVMELYYNDDLSLAEIAENSRPRITRQGVRDSIKRGEGILLDLEDKIGFAARYRAIQKNLAELEGLAKEIEFANANSYNRSDRVDTCVKKMLEIMQTLND